MGIYLYHLAASKEWWHIFQHLLSAGIMSQFVTGTHKLQEFTRKGFAALPASLVTQCAIRLRLGCRHGQGKRTCPTESRCLWVHTSCGLWPQSSLHQEPVHLWVFQAQTGSSPAAPSRQPVVRMPEGLMHSLSSCFPWGQRWPDLSSQ